MAKRKSQLFDEINKCKIELDETKKYTNRDLINLLGKYYLQLNPSKNTYGMRYMLNNVESPMLAERYSSLKPEEKLNLFEDDNWIAEKKYNGCRGILIYHPDTGFELFSRNKSEVDFLPISYTDKILFFSPSGKEYTHNSFIGKFQTPFVLDCELIAQGNIDTTLFKKYGNITETEQNATSVILSLDKEISKEVQRTQAQIKFHVFDILDLDGSIMNESLIVRKSALNDLFDIEKLNEILLFENSPIITSKNKKTEAWEHELRNKGEGLVFKNLNKEYYASENRSKYYQVKLKRSMDQVMKDQDLDDFDCFITGAKAGSKGSIHENLIGSVEFSIMLDKNDGTTEEHIIAYVSGINAELRSKMTVLDSKGKPILNPEYLNKVCVVNGMSISAKNLRLSHAECKFEFRQDKAPEDCKITEMFLRKNII